MTVKDNTIGVQSSLLNVKYAALQGLVLIISPGVILDKKLSIDEHIQYIPFKSTKTLGISRESRQYIANPTGI